MKLFLVESPGKVKTLQSFLGDDFVVKASVGHCFTISGDKSIDIKNNYEVTYDQIEGKEKIISEIKQLAKKSEIIYLASDGDREGECISWNIANEIIKDPKKIKRAVFHEITKNAVLNAIKNPITLNEPLFRAQQARSVLDLLVGFKVSPILWYKVCRGTSAGRVQSIGLQLIVDRQKEINAFITEEYWTIAGKFITSKKQSFETAYKLEKDKKILDKASSDKLVSDISKIKIWKISAVDKTRKRRHPNPIFNTSSLQQFCSNTFGWDGKRTMGNAQKLYEEGLITYHRTDSTNISEEAIKSVRNLISTLYGNKYVPASPNIFKSKNKNAQEAHEGIRPSHLEYSLDEVKGRVENDNFKLYEAIYSKFLACQMADSEVDATHIEVESDDKKHTFFANGQILVFDGFLKVDKYSSSKEEILPELQLNDKVDLSEIVPKQNFTKPPAAYNTASLVKKLEEEGVGRPSTYASIVDTLIKRKYAEKDGKAFKATDLGTRVCEYLQKSFVELMDIGYTARIEEQLDEVADNKKVWYEVVDGFYQELTKRIKIAKETVKEKQVSDITCPTCKKHKLVVRFGRFGKFYGCDGYSTKECSAMFKIGENGEAIEIVRKEKVYVDGKKCSCGGKLIIRENKKNGNKFAGCSNFPKCRNVYDENGEPIEKKQKEK